MNSETKFHVSVMDARLKKVKKQCDQYKKAYQHCVDDLIVLRANNKRLERENEKYDKQFTGYIDETNVYLNLLSEISQHIGNEPSSSTYKYFRAKLDNLNITEDK